MLVRESDHPKHQDEDVAFRTTYYFRVFDYCVSKDRAGGTLIARGTRLPLNDSLYRFRMTGKASTLWSDIRFEAGTLKAWQIDPFGASVKYDKNIERFRFISQQENDDEARRRLALADYEQLTREYEKLVKLAKESPAPSDFDALRADLVNAMRSRLNDYAPPSASASAYERLAVEYEKMLDRKKKSGSADFDPLLDDLRGAMKGSLLGGDKSLFNIQPSGPIGCPADAPQRRGFQVLGPEGWRTFDQDERLIMAMSSSAQPLISTLQDLSSRVLNAKAKGEALALPISQERLRIARAGTVLDGARPEADPMTLCGEVLRELTPTSDRTLSCDEEPPPRSADAGNARAVETIELPPSRPALGVRP